MSKEKENLDVRERILICAERLFIEKGYSNTSIRDICNEANTNVALVNYYFKSKKGLYKEIINLKTEPMIKALKGLSEDRDISSRDKFYRLFDIYSEFYEKNSDLPQLVAREVVTDTEISRWFHRHIIAKELVYIKKIFVEAQKDGVIRDEYEPLVLMSFCLGAMMFVLAGSKVIHKLMSNEFSIKGSIKERVEIIKELVLNGIAKK